MTHILWMEIIYAIETKKAIPTMVQIPLERTEGEQASRLQVIAIKPNKILPKQAIIALSPEYFHQLWLPASDANLNTCKLRIPQECFQRSPLRLGLFTASLI